MLVMIVMLMMYKFKPALADWGLTLPMHDFATTVTDAEAALPSLAHDTRRLPNDCTLQRLFGMIAVCTARSLHAFVPLVSHGLHGVLWLIAPSAPTLCVVGVPVPPVRLLLVDFACQRLMSCLLR